MSKMKFKLNRRGVIKLMKSPEMENILTGYAKRAHQKLGEGYTSDIYKGKTRLNASVGVDSHDAFYENKKHNTVIKAVFGGK